MKLAENHTYIESEDRLVVETVYDAEPALKEAEEARRNGGEYVFDSKNTRMLKACVIPMEHIQKVKEESGYDLLSPDPAQWRLALLYIQQHHTRFMATDKKVFTGREAQKWV